MLPKERRKASLNPATSLERRLNDVQMVTLRDLEHFGWELKFVRCPLFQDPVPVVFDGSRQKFAVLETDGKLTENPGFEIRH